MKSPIGSWFATNRLSERALTAKVFIGSKFVAENANRWSIREHRSDEVWCCILNIFQ